MDGPRVANGRRLWSWGGLLLAALVVASLALLVGRIRPRLARPTVGVVASATAAPANVRTVRVPGMPLVRIQFGFAQSGLRSVGIGLGLGL